MLNRVFINNQLATGCVKLRVDNPARPSVVCFDPKREIKAGDPIHITLVFEQSSRCDALVRAVAGPIFHGWRDVRTSEAAALGLDLSPSIQMGQWYDVTAKSSIYGEKDLVEIIDKERRLFADSEPSTLYSVGLSPLGGERDRQLYAPLSDAVHILTLSLFPGFREDWTLDRDLRSLGDTISSLGGKPWVYSWDPQAIREHFGDDSYVEMMGWLALVSGAKGLNYVSPGLSGRDPRYAESFRSRAGLADLIAGLNASLRGHGDILAPLLPMGSDEIKGLPTVKAYTAWAGDRGVVTVLANLSEDTYSAPQGTIPDFVAPVRIPLGYAATHAVDLLTGENVNVSHDGDRFSLKVDSIQTHRVFWIDLAKN